MMDQNNQIPGGENDVIRKEDEEIILWTDKKRPFFGKPISFTRYVLYKDRLQVRSGILIFRQEELRLYRVKDVTMRQTLLQRIFGVGSLKVVSTDSSTPALMIVDVQHPEHVMRLLSNTADSERQRYNVCMMEGHDIW